MQKKICKNQIVYHKEMKTAKLLNIIINQVVVVFQFEAKLPREHKKETKLNCRKALLIRMRL